MGEVHSRGYARGMPRKEVEGTHGGGEEVRQFEAIRLRSEHEADFGNDLWNGESDERTKPLEMLYLYYKLSYSGQFMTLMDHFS
jgi:hypothetical protein